MKQQQHDIKCKENSEKNTIFFKKIRLKTGINDKNSCKHSVSSLKVNVYARSLTIFLHTDCVAGDSSSGRDNQTQCS